MIKRFAFVRRRPDVTPSEFHAVWREAYAAELARCPALRQRLLRCELLHRLPEDYERARHSAEIPGPQ